MHSSLNYKSCKYNLNTPQRIPKQLHNQATKQIAWVHAGPSRFVHTKTISHSIHPVVPISYVVSVVLRPPYEQSSTPEQHRQCCINTISPKHYLLPNHNIPSFAYNFTEPCQQTTPGTRLLMYLYDEKQWSLT
jgi:hypothetical protein